MAKPRKTAEDACIDYAIWVADVRRLTKIIRENTCEVVGDKFAQAALDLHEPNDPVPESCLSQHWQITNGGPPSYYEIPLLPFDEMCAQCKTAWHAITDRREARKRLGAAKRSVEAIGKRLNNG